MRENEFIFLLTGGNTSESQRDSSHQECASVTPGRRQRSPDLRNELFPPFPPWLQPLWQTEALPWGLKSGNSLLFVLHFPKQQGLEGVLWEAGIPRPYCRELDIPAGSWTFLPAAIPRKIQLAARPPQPFGILPVLGRFFSGISALVSRGIWETGMATGEGILPQWKYWIFS